MVGVKAFVQDSRSRFLLVRRSTLKYPEVPPGWDIPGGRIHPGTPLLDNLKREIQEETKLTIHDQIRLIKAQDIIRPDKHIVRLTFVAHADGRPVLDEENDGYCWLTLPEIKQLPDLDEFARSVVDDGLLDQTPGFNSLST